MFKRSMFAVAIVLANQSLADGGRVEEVTIIGDPADAQQLPGSAFVVDKQELAKFEYTDINRMVRQVPGVYLQEEDGFGLRPNIGIRGAGAERSEKITLMEDGVLIAPAPYSAPAAYYFPTAGRMSGVEVLKGATILRHGPSTVAGVVNLISTRIPEEAHGQLNLEAGEFGSNRVNGGSSANIRNSSSNRWRAIVNHWWFQITGGQCWAGRLGNFNQHGLRSIDNITDDQFGSWQCRIGKSCAADIRNMGGGRREAIIQ